MLLIIHLPVCKVLFSVYIPQRGKQRQGRKMEVGTTWKQWRVISQRLRLSCSMTVGHGNKGAVLQGSRGGCEKLWK